jgi:hypothetical protein
MMSRIRSGSLGTDPDAPVVSLRHSPVPKSTAAELQTDDGLAIAHDVRRGST